MKIRIDFSPATLTPPTEAQVHFATQIAQCLGLDFPKCSQEYTFECFRDFIAAHVEEFYRDSEDAGDAEWYHWIGVGVWGPDW